MQSNAAFKPITLEEQVLRQDKMGKLRALSDAILRAKDRGEWVQRESGGWHQKYTQLQALYIAHLQAQYDGLRATLPKLRGV